MANQNPNPSVQNEGSKQEIAARKAQKEQEEKLKKGGTDTIKTVEGGGLADGVPFGIFPPSK
ncbi:MAG: hypothetical protein KGL35_07815 [Bradyrhizobium sp.]|nr:hypothetical protein [Pseudomonadota bacterium]MDE2468635.1 hypothetical protein [Bradyrhizobium sp.]